MAVNRYAVECYGFNSFERDDDSGPWFRSSRISMWETVKGNALRQCARLIDGVREELLNANWSGGIDGGSHSSVSSSSTVENRELTQAPLMAVSVGVRSGKRLLRMDKALRAGGSTRDNPFSRGRGGREVLRQVTRNDDDLMNYSPLGIDDRRRSSCSLTSETRRTECVCAPAIALTRGTTSDWSRHFSSMTLSRHNPREGVFGHCIVFLDIS